MIDYRNTPPPSLARKFDCFFDVFGNQSYATIKPRLRWRGTYVSTVPKVRNFLDHGRTLVSPLRRARMVMVRSRRPVIATVLPLSEVHKAHELIETRRTKGKIVLELVPG